METEIYYYSGTGNSLLVTKELQKMHQEADVKPIINLLEKKEIMTVSKIVGLVFPNFCLSIPIPVHDFLELANFESAEYIFAICVRGGTESQAFEYINEYLVKQGKVLNAQINISMGWNHPVGKENLIGWNQKEKIDLFEQKMKMDILELNSHIQKREDYYPEDTTADYKIPGWMRFVFGKLISHSQNYRFHEYMYQDLIRFYSDEKCNGCGICEKVCLHNKIIIENRTPIWKKEISCFACFACINYCPLQSIQIKKRFPIDSHTTENPRIHNPHIDYKEIALQK